MADREFDKINALKRIMDTLDGRDFLYQFLIDSCGIDCTVGIPNNQKDDYRQGIMKPGIDLFNLLIYHCHDKFNLMISEQKIRSNHD